MVKQKNNNNKIKQSDNKVLILKMKIIQYYFTLPLVLDLRPGTVRCKLVSERQLDKEFLMVPKISSLQALFIIASKDKGCRFWCCFQSAKAEIVVVDKFLNLDIFVLGEKIEGVERVGIGTLGLMILGGFKSGIYRAIALACWLCWSFC